jgi:Mg/Co/Ni transporter MgtE
MEFKTAAVVSCWLSIAIIAAVYMFLFAGSIGDVLFGVFLPVGLLVFVALIVTIYLAGKS